MIVVVAVFTTLRRPRCGRYLCAVPPIWSAGRCIS